MALPSSDEIRATVEKVLSSDDYHLTFEENALQPFWSRLIAGLLEFIAWVASFFTFLQGLPVFLQTIITITLLTLLIALVMHILYSIFSALSPKRSEAKRQFQFAERVDDPRIWETQADAFGASGKYIEAIRLLLRASLFRIEDSFDRPFRRGTTNREYLRKYRRLPYLDSVLQLVDVVDRKWYGEEPCDERDYETSMRSHTTIVESVRRRLSAAQETQ